MLLSVFQISKFIDAMQNVGGGCIYVRDSLETNVISGTTAKSADVEDIWVNVQGNMLSSFIVGAVTVPLILLII